jgi:hypothetical protein
MYADGPNKRVVPIAKMTKSTTTTTTTTTTEAMTMRNLIHSGDSIGVNLGQFYNDCREPSERFVVVVVVPAKLVDSIIHSIDSDVSDCSVRQQRLWYSIVGEISVDESDTDDSFRRTLEAKIAI